MAQQIVSQARYSVTLTAAAMDKVTQLLAGEKSGLALRVREAWWLRWL